MAARRGTSVSELQEAIFASEGFRVEFTPLHRHVPATLPPYSFREMAPQGWKLSDWQRVRLAEYIPYFARVNVYRGDGTPVGRDIRLGHLRDGYYAAAHGTLSPDSELVEEQRVAEPAPATGDAKPAAPARAVSTSREQRSRKAKSAGAARGNRKR